MNWLGLITGTGAGKWLALALAVGTGIGGYVIGQRVQRGDTEHVMRLWAEDRAKNAEESLKEYETDAAREARVRAQVLKDLAGRDDEIGSLAARVGELSHSVRLCGMAYAKPAAPAPPTGGTDAAGTNGQLEDAVGVLQTLAANLAERCDREAVRANALRDWVDGVLPPLPQ